MKIGGIDPIAAPRRALGVPRAVGSSLADVRHRLHAGRASELPALLSPGSHPPSQDPFYLAPATIGCYATGGIIATRPVIPRLGIVPVPVHAWQIAFRSNDHLDQPILAVTTLMVPRRPWMHPGPRPVVSYQAAEDAVGIDCAPSYALICGKGVGDLFDLAQVAPLLLKGWAVAVPDHEGPHAYFGTGINSGHITLDGLRAVLAFDRAGLATDSLVGMTGYSGGAQATGWAAQLHPSYAPELSLVGVAVGGMPADLGPTARYLDGKAFAGFEFAVAQSLGRAYPGGQISALLNDRGREDFDRMEGMGQGDILRHYRFRRIIEDVTVPDPLVVPAAAEVVRHNQMGLTGAPTVPVYDYHVLTDEVVPVPQHDRAVELWRRQGTPVKTVRDRFGEHAEEAVRRLGSVTAFLQRRFDGVPFEED